MIDRQTFLNIIRASIVTHRFDYARRAAKDWLAAWPGDAPVIELLAEAEIEEARANTAVERLKKLIVVDPERKRAYELLSQALHQSGDHFKAPLYAACAMALQESGDLPASSPAWIHAVRDARNLLLEGNLAEARVRAGIALAADPSIPLAAVSALRIERAAQDSATAYAIAEVGHNRWTDCLPFRLTLAEWYLEAEDQARGVEYLHRAVSDDPTGAIASSWLSEWHPYQNLWPGELVANLSKPVPAEIVAVLGGNTLAAKTVSGTAYPATGEMDPVVPAVAALALGRRDKSDRSTADSDVPTAGQSLQPSSFNPIDEDPDLPVPEEWEAFRGPDPGDRNLAAEDPVIQETRIEFERLAARLNTNLPSESMDARMPAYIILTSRTRLMQEFGERSFHKIDRAISELSAAVRRKQGWKAYKVYVDDPKALNPFGLVPVDPANAWGIKLQVSDLDRVLARRGEMIGSLLIVGGDRIIPFHMLPNPTDDDDEEVQSDNPYGTVDENYFITEWPVGRLPVDHDPGLLLSLIERCNSFHKQAQTRRAVRARLQDWLRRKLEIWIGSKPRSIGYSASIWKKASLAVFRTIGEPNALVTSPPIETGSYSGFDARSQYSYFNLHGLEDAPEWFGQRESSQGTSSGVEFPVALSPADIVNGGRAPEIVFSEACYGANVIAKRTEDALCLKFLASGSRAVVGSTKISYGSINPPLIAADLLGQLFWEQLRKRTPIGEALRRAKIKLAAEMHNRQGFLDGEDQKTLISFVLYGDPLFTPMEPFLRSGKSIQRQKIQKMKLKTACALSGPDLAEVDVTQVPLDQVKSIMANYLPGMADATLTVHRQTCSCTGIDHCCPTAQLGQKASPPSEDDRSDLVQVTFAKRITTGEHHHPRFARLTLNQNGKVLKLAVSR